MVKRRAEQNKFSEPAKFWPQWTERVTKEDAGLDPLGLSRVSDLLTGSLLPGITTTTSRARYYSFYTWAIEDIDMAKVAGSAPAPFDNELQRREAIFALASRIGAKTRLPVIGSRMVDAKLRAGALSGEVDASFRVLPSNPFGGFKQYYVGCLHTLGLIGLSDGQWSVASGLGQQIAGAFGVATQSAPCRSSNWFAPARRVVPLTVLEKSSQTFSLDAISGSSATIERELLIQLLFSLSPAPPGAILTRQGSLGQLLHVIEAYGKNGFEIRRGDVEQLAVFWPHYFGALDLGGGELLDYEPAPALLLFHSLWRQFCAHQFFAIALEEFLAAALDILAVHHEGLTEPDLIDALAGGVFLNDLETVLGVSCQDPRAFLAALGVDTIPGEVMSRELERAYGLRQVVNEWNILVPGPDAPPVTRLARAILVLGLLYGKWRGRVTDDIGIKHLAASAGQEACLLTGFGWLDEWLTRGPDWRTAIGGLFRWVWMRHEEVRFQKHNLDASWLEQAGNRFFRQQDIKPDFHSSRHGSAVTILQDLGLFNHAEPNSFLRLTDQGKAVLAKTIQARS